MYASSGKEHGKIRKKVLPNGGLIDMTKMMDV